MNFSIKPIVLAGIAGLTLAIAPVTVSAQAAPVTLAQRQQVQGLPPIFESIDLTTEQTAAIEDIMASSRQQVMGIFSQEQLQARQQTMAAGGTQEEAMAAMNLSTEQINQLEEIRRSRAEQIMAVLDETQKAELQEAMRQQGASRQSM